MFCWSGHVNYVFCKGESNCDGNTIDHAVFYSSKMDIFSNTEKLICDNIFDAIISRRFCDELYQSGMSIPDDPLQSISKSKRHELLKDIKINPFEVIIDEIEEK